MKEERLKIDAQGYLMDGDDARECCTSTDRSCNRSCAAFELREGHSGLYAVLHCCRRAVKIDQVVDIREVREK